MPNGSSQLPVLPRFGDPDSWAANVATKQDVADAKLAATTGSTTQTSITISGTGGSGFVALPTQSSAPAAPATGVALFANATGKFSWRNAADTYSRSFEMTATANRTFTLPDASFTFAGQNLANTFSVAQVFSANGALNAPAVLFTGTPITGGTATTTKPLVLIETAGATSNGWNTGGTIYGINASSIFVGNLIDAQKNGVSVFAVSSAGAVTTASSVISSANLRARSDSGLFTIGLSDDVVLTRKGPANPQLGAADAAAPVAQTLSVQSVVAGTTDTAGVNWTLNGSAGTGTGPGGEIVLATAPAGTTGSTQNARVSQIRVMPSGGFRLGGAGSTSPWVFTFSGTGSTSAGTVASASTGLSFFSNVSATSQDSFAFAGIPYTATGGTHNNVGIWKSFAPTSGTAVYNHLSLTPTINQTGGANGITRAIYVNPTLTAAADFRALEITDGNVVLPKTITAGGTTGAQTINKVTGSVNFAAAATSLVVTNSYVTANSIIIATVATNDTTMKSVAVVAGAGSFTIYANAAATAETRVNFFVTN